MQVLDLTLPTPQQNLACDEALLELCEGGCAHEIIRFWEPRDYFVVLGYSNKVATEVNLHACRAEGIPVLRRCSGGGTVLQGPGCLNYTLILKIDRSEELQSITRTNCFVMGKHRDAIQPLWLSQIEVEGYTDLATGGWKFSGNSQRRGRRFVLFHGCFLLRFDLGQIEKLLPVPSRQPAYRRNRSHVTFLRNLNVAPSLVKQALKKCWQATEPFENLPHMQIEKLVKEKYSVAGWNLKF